MSFLHAAATAWVVSTVVLAVLLTLVIVVQKVTGTTRRLVSALRSPGRRGSADGSGPEFIRAA